MVNPYEYSIIKKGLEGGPDELDRIVNDIVENYDLPFMSVLRKLASWSISFDILEREKDVEMLETYEVPEIVDRLPHENLYHAALSQVIPHDPELEQRLPIDISLESVWTSEIYGEAMENFVKFIGIPRKQVHYFLLQMTQGYYM